MNEKIMDLGNHLPGGKKWPEWLLNLGERLLGFHHFNVAHSKIEDDQKAGCTDEEIATLCDIAMCGDHGIGEAYGAVLDLPKCIAKGDDICSLRYHKK